MAIVTGRNQRWRVLGAHIALWLLIAVTLFPLLAVLSISLRPGNFSTGSLIPSEISLEHWKLALGIPTVGADGAIVEPPHNASLMRVRPSLSRSGFNTSISASGSASRAPSGTGLPSRRATWTLWPISTPQA